MIRNMKILTLMAFLLIINCHQSTDLVLNNNGFSEEFPSNEVPNEYPTTILPYDSVEVLRMLDEIKALNEKYNSKFKYMPPQLTRFGFPGSDTHQAHMYNHPNVVITNQAEMQYISKSTLETFGKYTGVTDQSLLRINSTYIHKSGIWLRIRTENQVYKRLEVKNTLISVWLDANGVYSISGNWYNYIYP